MQTKHIHTTRTFKTVFLFAIGLSIVASIHAVTMATRPTSAVNLQRTLRPPVVAVVPPVLIPPPEAAIYTPDQDIRHPITAATRSIAQLDDAVAEGIESIYTYVPESAGSDNGIVFQILSSVQYKLKGYTLTISTAMLSSPEMSLTPTVFEDQEIKLSNGTIAWGAARGTGSISNTLVFLRGDLIITLASDMPLDQLEKIALRVVTR